jgi:hypothetical protein
MEVDMIALRRTGTFIIVAILLAVLFSGPAQAAPVGSFAKVEGGVDLLRPGAREPVPVRTGDPVSMGDAVRTKRDGKAEIQFIDETLVQLAPETRIKIDEYTFRAGGARDRGLLSLFRGKLRAIVSRLKATVVPAARADAGFNIKTPTAIAGVKGTDFIVYYNRGVSGVVFLDGDGFVYNPARPDQVVPIRKGQATFVPRAGGPPLRPRPVSAAFIAPHVRDTTVGRDENGQEDNGQAGQSGTGQAGPGQEGQAGQEGGGEPAGEEPLSVDILDSNTSLEALTDTVGQELFTPPVEPPGLPTIIEQLPPELPPQQIVPTPPTTPVTVNVKLP